MILLSFDIEEFDLPFEYGLSLSWEEQIRISSEGCRKILSGLSHHEVKSDVFLHRPLCGERSRADP